MSWDDDEIWDDDYSDDDDDSLYDSDEFSKEEENFEFTEDEFSSLDEFFKTPSNIKNDPFSQDVMVYKLIRIDKNIWDNFARICKEKSLIRSSYLEEKMREFIEHHEGKEKYKNEDDFITSKIIDILDENRVDEYRFYKKIRNHEKGARTLGVKLKKMYENLENIIKEEKNKINCLKREYIEKNKKLDIYQRDKMIRHNSYELYKYDKKK